ncbi:hypothetical protein PCC7424_0404 [Gloeothece citriformis PCC 7424]|uniref:Uncharacterized protein n=1 Tax=Gloeothece citriformis (strain PCC 7424) TaxID=65393 RepID=B7KC48_GLOC7|nr:hypothetical protein PCC7424_0404 [Gloeothece citriformis PCC 7424]
MVTNQEEGGFGEILIIVKLPLQKTGLALIINY